MTNEAWSATVASWNMDMAWKRHMREHIEQKHKKGDKQ